jgi:hypothetical protein
MTPNEVRIASLEAENARLRAEVERLRPPPRVVKIDGPFMPPSIEQVERLVKIVLAKYPMLDPATTRDPIPRDEFVRQVRSGMVYLGTLHRTRGKTNSARAYVDWLYLAGDHLVKVACQPSDIRGSSLMVAAVASADVPYSPPHLFPRIANLGVIVGVQNESYAASNRWLGLLSGSDFDPRLVVELSVLLHA